MSFDNIVSDRPQPELLRTIGYWQVTLYATGSMLGAGIYGLIGLAAGKLGAAVDNVRQVFPGGKIGDQRRLFPTPRDGHPGGRGIELLTPATAVAGRW